MDRRSEKRQRYVNLNRAIAWTPAGTGILRCPACEQGGARISETKIDSTGVRVLFLCSECEFGFAIKLSRERGATFLRIENEFPAPVVPPAVPKPVAPGQMRLDPQRSFSGEQRKEIYLRADGHCIGCGSPLDSDWHADHIVPHSRGGKTEVINGQALCQPCNSRKSAKVLTIDEG